MIGSIVVTSTNTLILFTTIRSLRGHRKWAKIHRIYNKIEKNLQLHWKRQLNVTKFLKTYCAQVLFVILIFVVLLIVKFTMKYWAVGWTVEMSYSFFRIYRFIVALHALFYVKLLTALIDCSQEFPVNFLNINHHQNSNVVHSHQIDEIAKQNHLIEIIKQYKNIHYTVHTAITLLNDIFGWTFVSLLILNSLDFAYASYWVYYFLERKEEIFIIRRFFF